MLSDETHSFGSCVWIEAWQVLRADEDDGRLRKLAVDAGHGEASVDTALLGVEQLLEEFAVCITRHRRGKRGSSWAGRGLRTGPEWL